MPKYQTFQYAIKKYGKYEQSKNHSNSRLLLGARLRIQEGQELVTIYASRPKQVAKNPKVFRLKTNLKETLIIRNATINGHPEKVRLRVNTDRMGLVAKKGWG